MVWYVTASDLDQLHVRGRVRK